MIRVVIPPREQCIRAYQSRDARFDGWFILGVVTTGIYCRPSCPTPVAPKPKNVRFFATSAAAQRGGFRACKRCRPDASPGSPEWNVREDMVARAMRLIADGVIDREGVSGLARRLAMSERHLGRVLTAEVGAGPLALARAQRAQTARVLIETTTIPFAEVAVAAGFRSVRQFNDTIREIFAGAPRDLRSDRMAHGGTGTGSVGIAVRLPFRAPYDADAILRFLGDRTIDGVESWNGTVFRRALRLPGGTGVVTLGQAPDHITCRIELDDVGDLQAALQRLRRLLDLDADPIAVTETLGQDPALGPLVRRRPGLRSPGAVDAAELVARAVVGQQISVRGARTVLGRIAASLGAAVEGGDGVVFSFPSSHQLADAPDDVLRMPAARRGALRETCRRLAAGELDLGPGADRKRARAQLLTIPGIGPWTAEYIAMRGLADPDAFPAGDLGIRHAALRLGLPPTTAAVGSAATAWSPWRAYAAHHLWKSLEDSYVV